LRRKLEKKNKGKKESEGKEGKNTMQINKWRRKKKMDRK